jgi:ribosomal protein S18
MSLVDNLIDRISDIANLVHFVSRLCRIQHRRLKKLSYCNVGNV